MKDQLPTTQLRARNLKLAKAVTVLVTANRIMLDGLEAIACARKTAKANRSKAAATIKATRKWMDIACAGLRKGGQS
jgi:hypothetical protein